MAQLSTFLGVRTSYKIINTQTFTSNGTWTKPTNAAMVRVVLCGGGGSGMRPAANASNPVSGGSAAPMVSMSFPAAALDSTVSVTVGAGGAAVTATNTIGNDGGYSSFGEFLEAVGGNGGKDNDTARVSWYNSHPNAFASADNITRTETYAPGASRVYYGGQDGAAGWVGGGGGPSGDVYSSSAGRAGGARNRNRGNYTSSNGGTAGTAGGATGGNGGAGAAGEIRATLGGGGGGGGGSGTTTGGVGGAGGAAGGGGGAGGHGVTTSGNSGAGGAGAVYIETWG